MIKHSRCIHVGQTEHCPAPYVARKPSATIMRKEYILGTSQDGVAVHEAAGGRSARLRGRRYGQGSIGGAVPRIPRVSGQRPEQLVGSLRKPSFTVTKTNVENLSASSIASNMGWIRR